jgi:hypothetical protein
MSDEDLSNINRGAHLSTWTRAFAPTSSFPQAASAVSRPLRTWVLAYSIHKFCLPRNGGRDHTRARARR